MTGAKFAACDFGAQSGRVILGTIGHRKIELREIHRFTNHQVPVLGHIYWDLLHLFREMKHGLAQIAAEGNKDLQGVGVDTWGVDFGFLSSDGSILGNPVAYRDSRTNGMMDWVFGKICKEELYQETGIQFLQLNTIFQIASLLKSESPVLSAASDLLMMPDLFNYLMTGEICSEYSIASTSQLLNARSGGWSRKIFDALQIEPSLMPTIIQPGTIIAKLTREVENETGLSSTSVIAPPCHDTASAVAAVPAKGNNWAYLSSGTWSLMGIEISEPIIDPLSEQNNFTNEGGYGRTIRFLRNNMGMWLLEKCRIEWKDSGNEIGYPELLQMARHSVAFRTLIEPDDPCFLNPADMCTAIRQFARNHNQPLPETEGEFTRCIFESLALKYRIILDQINSMRPEKIEQLHIVGGGSQNSLLNQYTANALGIPVLSGPVEATAIGNIAIQGIARGVIGDLNEAREMVRESFELAEFEPQEPDKWEEPYARFRKLFGYN